MRKLLTMMVAAFFGCPLFATTWYVNGTSGADSYSGTSSASAKKTIQTAIDVAAEGDIILVAAGMYTPVCCMNKRIVVKSTAGASVTAIVGAEGKRCVTIQNYGDIPSCDTFAENGVRTNTVIEGFALMDGHPSMFGNGGGGANGGTLRRCIIRDCEACGGGGAASAVLESCLVDGNRAVNGGNIIGCVAINCTIVNGYATDNGGGYYNCSVLNSIAFGNDSGWRWGDDGGQSYQPSGEGGLDGSGRVVYGVVKENPGFVDAAKGDYRLAAGSPCIDAGDNSYVTSETDLDGKARIVNGRVDIGCYEYGSSLQNGLVAHYRFDGNANDSSGSSKHLNSSQHGIRFIADRNGNLNRACHFENEGSLYHPEKWTVDNGGTYSFWVKAECSIPRFFEEGNTVFDRGDEELDTRRAPYVIFPAWASGPASGYPWSGVAGVGVSVGSNGVMVHEHADAYIPAILVYQQEIGSDWVHIVVTCEKDGAPSLYVNGNLVRVGVSTGCSKVFGLSPEIPVDYDQLEGEEGEDGVGGGCYGHFTGALDDLRIYNRALSAAEVKAVYESNGASKTWYVNGTSGSDSYSGSSSAQAKKTIQAAIDAAADGDKILVAAGTYAPIETGNKCIEIQGVAGRENTIIDGEQSGRCAYLGDSTNECQTVSRGFTLKNGYEYISWQGHAGAGVRGGTVQDCIITNCIVAGGWSGYGGEGGGVVDCKIGNSMIVGCSALAGGGVCSSIIDSCIIRGCYSEDDGGGAHSSVLFNCLVVDNYGCDVGGYSCGYGLFFCEAYNCTIVNNAGRSGGGVSCSKLFNSIIYGNEPENLSAPTSRNGTNELIRCAVEDPQFVNAANGDYHLAAGSPCIDAGDNSYVTSETDLDGNARIVSGKVDIGCYEYQGGQILPQYIVTFNANGGVCSTSSKQYASGAAVGNLPTATWEGYDFLGWFTSVTGGTQVTAATVVTEDVTYYAQWKGTGDGEPGSNEYYKVSFNANGGKMDVPAKTIAKGAAIGELPILARAGYEFLGWFTAAVGGTQVTAATVVTEDVTFYAQWKAQVPDIAPKEDQPMDAGIANVYDGVITDADGLPIGSVNVKAGKISNTGTSKVTVTIQMAGEAKKVSIKGEVNVADAVMSVTAKDGRKLDLMFMRNTISGTFDGYLIEGRRNLLASSGSSAEKSAAEATLNRLVGNYVFAYDDELGWGGLSLAIMKKGKCKISGKLANGKGVATTSQMIIGEDYCCVPVIYTKKENQLAFSIYFPNDGKEPFIFGFCNAIISPVTALGLGLAFRMGDGIYDPLDMYEIEDGYLPDGVSVEQLGTKWIVANGAKAGKIKMDREEGIYDANDSENPSGLKLTFTAKTGLFKGSFKVYGVNANGKLKSFSATVNGVVIDGHGYGTATGKKFGSVAVTIE